MAKREVNFLLVDDDEVDTKAVKRAFRMRQVINPLHTARDGVEALEKLRGAPGSPAIPRPYIILLDLNMPRMDGIEFLRALRQDPQHKDAVVFVLTTSEDDRDKQLARDLNVTGYIVKSRVSREFLELVSMLDQYWRLVELPA
jgi:CheY-like chemotaxis protein